MPKTGCGKTQRLKRESAQQALLPKTGREKRLENLGGNICIRAKPKGSAIILHIVENSSNICSVVYEMLRQASRYIVQPMLYSLLILPAHNNFFTFQELMILFELSSLMDMGLATIPPHEQVIELSLTSKSNPP